MKLLIILFLITSHILHAGDTKEKLAILDFTNSSKDVMFNNNNSDERVLLSLEETLYVKLLGHFRVVERHKMETLEKEMRLGHDGYLKERDIIHLGEMSGAKYVITGSITEYAYESRSHRGTYDVYTTVETHRMTVIFKIIDIKSSELIYGDQILVEEKYRISPNLHTTETDLARKLGRAAAEKIKESIDKFMAKRSEMGDQKSFALKVTTDPTNAMLFIDDAFKGQTPITLMLKSGKHQMKISMPGYLDLDVPINHLKKDEFNLTLHKDER